MSTGRSEPSSSGFYPSCLATLSRRSPLQEYISFTGKQLPDECSEREFRHEHNTILSQDIHWRRHKDDFILDNDRPDWYRNKHTTDVYGTEFQATFVSGRSSISIGGEACREEIESSRLGDHSRDRIGLFIEHQLDWKRRYFLTWGAFGCMYTGWEWKACPGIDLGIRLSERLRVYSTVGGSFRVPTFTDLYYDSPANMEIPI